MDSSAFSIIGSFSRTLTLDVGSRLTVSCGLGTVLLEATWVVSNLFHVVDLKLWKFRGGGVRNTLLVAT